MFDYHRNMRVFFEFLQTFDILHSTHKSCSFWSFQQPSYRTESRRASFRFRSFKVPFFSDPCTRTHTKADSHLNKRSAFVFALSSSNRKKTAATHDMIAPYTHYSRAHGVYIIYVIFDVRLRSILCYIHCSVPVSAIPTVSGVGDKQIMRTSQRTFAGVKKINSCRYIIYIYLDDWAFGLRESCKDSFR